MKQMCWPSIWQRSCASRLCMQCDAAVLYLVVNVSGDAKIWFLYQWYQWNSYCCWFESRVAVKRNQLVRCFLQCCSPSNGASERLEPGAPGVLLALMLRDCCLVKQLSSHSWLVRGWPHVLQRSGESRGKAAITHAPTQPTLVITLGGYLGAKTEAKVLLGPCDDARLMKLQHWGLAVGTIWTQPWSELQAW